MQGMRLTKAPAAWLALCGSSTATTPRSPKPFRGEQSQTLQTTQGLVEPVECMRTGSVGMAPMLWQGQETMVPTQPYVQHRVAPC